MGVALARKLRKNMTEAEKLFWYHVRDRQLSGYKFRRQLPVGPYVADFACLETKLIVEIDGGQHNGSLGDIKRDADLNTAGFKVARYWNNDVLNNIDGVLSTLTLTLSQRERELQEKCYA